MPKCVFANAGFLASVFAAGMCAAFTLSVGLRRSKRGQAFDRVTVVKKANVYFDGKVTSRTILFPDGSKKTLGILMPGEYEFLTADKEIMEILSGDLHVFLPGEKHEKIVHAGDSFEVPPQSKFKIRCGSLVDYCCSYLKSNEDFSWRAGEGGVARRD